jgi:hypothetical protein
MNLLALCSDDSACGVCAGIRMILAEHDNATAYAKRLRGERDAARQQLKGAVGRERALAEAIISLADSAGMPDSFRETDSRMILARQTLDRVGGR